MADFPLACNVQGDYGYKVIVVDDNDTISQVIKKAAAGVVGFFIPPFPDGTVLQARIHGSDEFLSDNISVKEANLLKMEAIDISSGV
ncbi:MAG: hypothetical protein ACI9CO_000500 [Candidatus Azotimanducaceae bacterium]|jgi:hypothetical protein